MRSSRPSLALTWGLGAFIKAFSDFFGLHSAHRLGESSALQLILESLLGIRFGLHWAKRRHLEVCRDLRFGLWVEFGGRSWPSFDPRQAWYCLLRVLPRPYLSVALRALLSFSVALGGLLSGLQGLDWLHEGLCLVTWGLQLDLNQIHWGDFDLHRRVCGLHFGLIWSLCGLLDELFVVVPDLDPAVLFQEVGLELDSRIASSSVQVTKFQANNLD